MFFYESARQERIPNWTRERDVNDTPNMDVSDFRASKAKLCASKAMGVSRDIRPLRCLGQPLDSGIESPLRDQRGLGIGRTQMVESFLGEMHRKIIS